MKNQKLQADKPELAELQAKCEEYLNGWKRAKADYENLQKETSKKFAEAGEYLKKGLILQILPIYDHFKLALAHIPKEQLEADWVQGIFHIKKQFADFLKDLEVSEIQTVGQKFNHHLHQAVGYEKSEVRDQEIIREIKAGYNLGDQLLQPAQVVVSKNQPPPVGGVPPWAGENNKTINPFDAAQGKQNNKINKDTSASEAEEDAPLINLWP